MLRHDIDIAEFRSCVQEQLKKLGVDINTRAVDDMLFVVCDAAVDYAYNLHL